LEIEELNLLHFDLNLTGFDRLEIDQILASDGEPPQEETGEPPQKPVTRLGDLWLCGRHRVLCGDATEEVARLLGPATPFLMVTDPPYGVEYDPAWRERAGLGPQRQTGTVANDDRANWETAYRLFPGDVAYVWHAGVHAAKVAAGLESAGLRIRSQIIWAKPSLVLSRATITGSMNPAGTLCARDGGPTGVEIANSPLSGKSPI
jgi:hypothetical protein